MALMRMGAASSGPSKKKSKTMRVGALAEPAKEEPAQEEPVDDGKEACPECGKRYARLSAHMVVHED